MTSLCAIMSICMLMQEAKAEYRFQQATPLKTVLNNISNHYKVTILFEESLVQGKTTTYKFNPSGITLDKVLDELLSPLGLRASKIDDSNYAIVQASQKSNAAPQEVISGKPQVQQPQTVIQSPEETGGAAAPAVLKGRVVSEDNDQPIPRASVMVKGTGIGTTTDAEGYFSIKVPESRGTITIGHINFAQQELRFDTRLYLAVKLKTRVKEMESVVVTTGMFKRAKETFTGASTVVTGDALRQVNSVSVLEGLKVFDPAIRIPENIQFGSDPNRLPQITMRGTNNFPQQTTGSNTSVSGADFMANYANNPNQPLFILDGFEVSLQKIYDLDINRIASITTLKDAAATSIYGSRAANGVIVIETKQPQSGKLRLSYSGMLQVSAPDLTVYDLADAAEKLEVERLAGQYSKYADGIRPDADAILRSTYAQRKAAIERGVNTYWLAQPVRTGIGQRHSLYMEGGDNFIRYGLDLSYFNNSGVMKNSNRDVYAGGMNFSYRNKGFLFKNVISVTYNKAVNSNYGSFAEYSRLNQYWSPFDSTGNLVKVMEGVKDPLVPTNITSYLNPLYNTTINTVNEAQYTGIINQTNIDWLLNNGFRLTGRLQINKQHDESDVFLPAQHTRFETITDFTRRGSYTKGSGKFFSY
ncbi:MAG TPA: carboxypeptidase-like regulatory domain-containing protein, partial [Chitinophagaceae bacterium]